MSVLYVLLCWLLLGYLLQRTVLEVGSEQGVEASWRLLTEGAALSSGGG